VCIKELFDGGYIREDIWRNDATAIAIIINPSPDTDEWIDKVLSDPVSGKEAVATSRF